ncbi:TPA: TIGR04255 family protein [Pseudomonas aeruginosa]|uniref:TIGR04255 family protein n=1 Tax=Pseudomonas aeruginosa TaxID=287 RepID=UPI0009A39E06|nr:TIGR04255 family protein [Pseudomonas aeruginosa]EKJ6825974.1 TIGR04255 family protein [Pseudomonas aeruginosa]EMB4307586.1 TIGR04255 family protein [Pseudomonas aeruginosa]EMD6027124.1 TIGR04255 family protein [Pseudomonas aeruginosa]MBG5588798.1 TIGR04255 family protein [Pseudomonas aeruginosa]MBH8871817.1 TIGR04255 family protein [Pseudomonas aeruginosa]
MPNPLHQVPTKLGREPLIDAVFEMRFSSGVAVGSILPGILFSALQGKKSIEPTPIMSMPKEVREMDPNLRFAPLFKLGWDRYWVFVGDNSCSVSSKLPYAGWSNLRSAIYEVMAIACSSGLIDSVNRYSMKYIDIISHELDLPASEVFTLNLGIGDKTTINDYEIRVSFTQKNFEHSIRLISDATTQLIGESKPRQGKVIDIDSFANIGGESAEIFLAKIIDRSDEIHKASKEIFFECLSERALNWLEPSYE